jgi:hypothetical protein
MRRASPSSSKRSLRRSEDPSVERNWALPLVGRSRPPHGDRPTTCAHPAAILFRRSAGLWPPGSRSAAVSLLLRRCSVTACQNAPVAQHARDLIGRVRDVRPAALLGRHEHQFDRVIERSPPRVDRSERLKQHVGRVLQRDQAPAIGEDERPRQSAIVVWAARRRHGAECSAGAVLWVSLAALIAAGAVPRSDPTAGQPNYGDTLHIPGRVGRSSVSAKRSPALSRIPGFRRGFCRRRRRTVIPTNHS